MKVRQLKHYAQSGMAWNSWMIWMEQRSHKALQTKLATTPEPAPKADAFHTEPVYGAQACKQEFVVLKKSTGEVVDTFDTRADAVALIEKHKRQKKAALVLLDTAEALA